ncbi:hypothetical protein ACROYT_G012978 [Oculina patagonica]
MDPEMKCERSVLRNLFIISNSCIYILANTVMLLVQNICAYLQNELEEFNDIHEKSADTEQHTDPEFIAYIKGEETVSGMHCSHTTSENVENRSGCLEIKKSIQEEKCKKVQRNIPKSLKRNKNGNKTNLRMKPPPVEELVLRKESVVRTEKVNSISIEVSHRVSFNERFCAGVQTSHYCGENYAPDSASKDAKALAMKTLPISSKFAEICKHLQFFCILDVVVSALVRSVQKLSAYIQREVEEFNNIYGHHTEDLPYTEPAFIAYLKGDDTAPYTFRPHVRSASSPLQKNRPTGKSFCEKETR